MINKFVIFLLLGTMVSFGASQYKGSTVASVTLAGGIIKAQTVEVTKKYKRKDCPICEGKGWYISGDGIKKVDCGYCEPEKQGVQQNNQNVITHPPTIIKPNCTSGSCAQQTIIKR